MEMVMGMALDMELGMGMDLDRARHTTRAHDRVEVDLEI
jgi:hypothetical protein